MSHVDILSQATSDPDTKLYHVRDELVEKTETAMKGDLSDDCSEFMRLFFKLRGVMFVKITPYAVLICKGSAFSWDEVAPHVEALLSEYTMSQKDLRDALEPKH